MVSFRRALAVSALVVPLVIPLVVGAPISTNTTGLSNEIECLGFGCTDPAKVGEHIGTIATPQEVSNANERDREDTTEVGAPHNEHDPGKRDDEWDQGWEDWSLAWKNVLIEALIISFDEDMWRNGSPFTLTFDQWAEFLSHPDMQHMFAKPRHESFIEWAQRVDKTSRNFSNVLYTVECKLSDAHVITLLWDCHRVPHNHGSGDH